MLNQRCHAIRSIRGHQGLISAHMQGTIEAEISNLGRHLIAVRWDNGLEMYVFPEEIEIDQGTEKWHEDELWPTTRERTAHKDLQAGGDSEDSAQGAKR
jgi:hypothetical protein